MSGKSELLSLGGLPAGLLRFLLGSSLFVRFAIGHPSVAMTYNHRLLLVVLGLRFDLEDRRGTDRIQTSGDADRATADFAVDCQFNVAFANIEIFDIDGLPAMRTCDIHPRSN